MNFAISAGITVTVGILLNRRIVKLNHLRIVDGMAIVTFGWIFASLFGALPYLFSGIFHHPVDALFESISGLSTTGATVLSNIEGLPYSILFWRSFTQWIGGMGILVFTIALLPSLEGGSLNVLKAESAGTFQERTAPRVKSSARLLYMTYSALTLLMTLLLWVGSLSFFDSLMHAFATVATAGFSTKNIGVAYFDSPYIHWVISLFMLLSGINFAILISVIRGRFELLKKNSELKFYLSAIGVGALGVGLSLLFQTGNLSLSARNGFLWQYPL